MPQSKLWQKHRTKTHKSGYPGGGGWIPMPKAQPKFSQKIPTKRGIRTVKGSHMRKKK
jgi:hypothetical protein